MIDIKFICKPDKYDITDTIWPPFDLSKEQQEHYRKLLRNIVLDAKSLYDGYPSKHQTDLYNFAKELLKVL